MAGKYDVVGKIELRGKAAKIVIDAESGDPVKFFCFVEDLDRLLNDPSRYVNVYRDNPGD